MSNPFAPPDWAIDIFKKTDDTIAALVYDPALIIEGICQNASDTVEEKGIVYAGGYIAGDIMIDIFITKGLDKLRAIKAAKLSDEAVEAGSLIDEIAKVDELNPRVADNIIEGSGKIPQEIIEKGKKITNFENPADPIRDILGSGMNSHPEEWNKIIKELEDSGIEVVYREGIMGYGPLRKGEPGQIVIDPNASYSALNHEYNHFLNAKSKGFPSAADAYQDWEGRIADELKSYTVEIEEAQKLGLDNVVEQLQKNFEAEKQYIIERYGPIE